MKLAPLSKNIPQFSWDAVRVTFASYQVGRLKDAGLMDLVCEMRDQGYLPSDDLAHQPGRYLICARGSYGVTKLLDKVGSANVELVWSMWSGYWERDGCAMREWAEREGVERRLVHSGGHAWPEDLERLALAVAAKQTIWVHTDCGDIGAETLLVRDRLPQPES